VDERTARKADAFAALHSGTPFVIPNPWDAGSARVLEALGFKALATTSSGFAFALGISTVIDLVVFFLFTKPMVSWLATFRFFSSGHKLSGLSPDHVGTSRPSGASRPSPAGGNA
jgi:preprotein translocase subunit SecD